MDLVGPMNSTGFGEERYFFIFINNFSRYIETYMESKKSDWFKYLKTFQSPYQNQSKERYPVEQIWSDYDSELQSKVFDEWLTKESITFEPSTLYSQKQNGVYERWSKIRVLK